MKDWLGSILFLLVSAAGFFFGKGLGCGIFLFPATLLVFLLAFSIYGTKRANGIMLLFVSVLVPAHIIFFHFPLRIALPLYVMIFAVYCLSEFLRRQSAKEMAVFLDYIKQAGSASTIEKVCVPALDLIKRLMPDSAPAVALYDKKRNLFQILSAHDEYTGEGVSPDGTVPFENHVYSRVFVSGKPLIVDDIRSHPPYVEGTPGARSGLVVPIVWRDQKSGVIVVESRKLARFSSTDLRGLQFFAVILGEILTHLQVEQKLEANVAELKRTNEAFSSTQKALSNALDVSREQKANLEVLLKKFRDLFDIVQGMSLCRSAEELFPLVSWQLSQRLGYKNVYVFSRESFSKEITLQTWVGKLPEELKDLKGLEKGILLHVLETGEPYLATDVSKDPLYLNLDSDVRCQLIVPVISSNGLWGAIAVDDDVIGGITNQDQEFLGVIAAHMALELENKESFARLNVEVNRLRTLLDIVQSFSVERADFEQVAPHVVQMLTSVFNYEKISIFRVEKKEDASFFLRALASNFVSMADLDEYSQKLYENGGGLVIRCAERGEIINTPNLAASSYYVNLSSKSTTSQLDIPILFGGEVFAVISMEKNSPFVKSDEGFFMILSKHLAALVAVQTAIEETKRKALIDDLTQLWNRRFLSMRIAEEQSRHERFGDPASMVMIDMANFKLINDTYGHLVGDKVLKSFASLLSECVRAGDIAGRFGGDEFLLILPGTVQKQAFHLVKRLQSSLEALRVEGVLHNISADFGVATVPEDASSLHEALKIADDRMYQSKVERRRRQEENKGT